MNTIKCLITAMADLSSLGCGNHSIGTTEGRFKTASFANPCWRNGGVIPSTLLTKFLFIQQSYRVCPKNPTSRLSH